MFWEWPSNDERSKYAEFCKELTVRAGCSLLRYHLHEMHPERLEDTVWCEALADVWYNKMSERIQSKDA